MAHSTNASGPRGARAALLVVVVTAASCGGDAAESGPAGIDFRDVPIPCRVEGYPCTWNEVPEATVTRTKQLGHLAARLTLTTPSLDSVAAFLDEREGMAEVVIDGTGVRYRLEGGRPAWVFLSSEMDHHRGTPEAVAGRGVASVPRGAPPPSGGRVAGVVPLTRAARALGAWLGPAPLHAASARQSRRQAVAGEPGEGKKALVLSPYEHEFPGVGADFTSRARLVRDYRERAGGSVLFRADLDPYSDNPAAAGSEYRTVGGDPTLSGEVRFEDFLGWDDYNLIILATHGGNASCRLPAPVGGAQVESRREPPRGRPGPDLRPRPDSAGGCPLIYAGRAKQQSYGDYIGVEIYFAMGRVRREERPADAQTRYDTPGRREWRDSGSNLREGLTPAEARTCEAAVLANVVDPMTDGGQPCLIPTWEHDNPMLVLWWPFFINQYPEGLDNTIVFLAACHSAKGNVLLDALARPGNEAVTVFGFNTAVYAPRAWAIIRHMIELVDAGWHSDELVRRLREYDERIAADPEYQTPQRCDDGSCTPGSTPDSVVRGRALDPHDEILPDVPAELIDETPVATHGRDVVLLIDPRTGEELRDGGSVRVLGTPGDDRADRLELHPQILGVVDEADLRDIRLEVRVVDEAVPDETYTPGREVDEGAYRYDRDIALGRDHDEGEVVDLEVRVDLPGGNHSRWVYDNIRLIGLCYWTASIRGDLERELGGEAVSIGHLDGGSLGVFGGVTLSQAPGEDEQRDGIWFQIMGVPAQRDYAIDPRRGEAGAMLMTREAPWGTVRRGQLRLSMVSDTMTIGGFAIEYDGLTMPEFDADRFTITGEFVWTPSCPTWMDHMMELGQRTREFVESRMR